ncbi:MAG: TIGR03936 family radical SAM-associated protein [Clostridiales bacterium]|nr:TIGR03936 family radical SAM-associated protein [Clostridiales bacterium]
MASITVLPAGPVRIRFEKRGSMKFISHLDLQRTMNTAFNRAALPVWYTEGFNPHKKLVFALPLPIGAESVCELLDFKITEMMPAEEIVKRLNAAFSPELNVFEAYSPSSKFADIGWAEYAATSPELVGRDLSPLTASPLIVRKRTKSGEKDLDISPLIRDPRLEGDTLTMLLSAEPDSYLNPDYPLSALGIADYTVMRKEIYRRDGVTPFR